MVRALLAETSTAELSPEATAGFIVGFIVLGFLLAVLAAFGLFQNAHIKGLEDRLLQVGAALCLLLWQQVSACLG